MNNKGQSIFSEYVMIFFVVIAALVAMSVLLQRSFEARIHDTRNYMIKTVNSACDANCMQAAGGKITYEYEPYYAVMQTTVHQFVNDTSGATQGKAQVLGVKYVKTTQEKIKTNTPLSCQMPPACAGYSNAQSHCECQCPPPPNCP